MKYELINMSIKELVELIDRDNIDLKPFYQRNDIWSVKDQNELIDSIINGYPIPNFFIYKRNDGMYEMVDGQQRSRTIYRFVKGKISSSLKTGKIFFADANTSLIEEYALNITLISDVSEHRTLQDFYVLVNKKGKHLNTAELNKADFAETRFLKLVEDIIESELFESLDLFTESTKKRMADRSFVEELVAYLKLGINDKKIAIQRIYQNDISEDEVLSLREIFDSILAKISILNEEYPIKKTRYKQRNDFYTLFCFIHKNIAEDEEILKYQYSVLRMLDGLNLIRPSIDDCEPLKTYALNCVSQSNSKNARIGRLDFFNAILKNRGEAINDTLRSVLLFLDQEYEDYEISLKPVGVYRLINYDNLIELYD